MNYKLKFSSLFYTTNSYVVNGLDMVRFQQTTIKSLFKKLSKKPWLMKTTEESKRSISKNVFVKESFENVLKIQILTNFLSPII
jgi:hypothetical protein